MKSLYSQILLWVSPPSEVSVVARHDSVLLPLLDVLPIPLADAGAAGISQDDPAELPHGVGQPVPLYRGADLLAARRDVKSAFGLQSFGQCL